MMPLFLLLVFGLMQIAALFFWQQMLDYAVHNAGRQIQIGQAQGNVTSQAQFSQQYVCPNTGGMLRCELLLTDVQGTADFRAGAAYAVPQTGSAVNTGGFSYCDGAPGQPIVVHAVYMAPFFAGRLLPMATLFYQGSWRVPLVASAAFTDEWFPASSAGNPC